MKTVIAAVIASTVPCALAAASTELIINEYNSVRDDRWLGCGEGAAGATCIRTGETSSDTDHFLGRRIGNGGDWIEFVVTVDHADVRGWKLQWVSTAPSSTGLPVTDGTDIWFGDTALPQGEFTFSGDAIWSDLRAGTIITITRDGTASGGLDTDTSFNPCLGDWWINVNCFDASLVTCVANVYDPTTPNYDDPLDVGNDNWRARIVDETGAIVIGLVGENAPGWAGTGINSKEVGKLEEDPRPTVTPSSNYQDANNSTFGQPNSWNNDFTGCRTYQDFEPLRAAVRAELCQSCMPLVLNEYNAVSSTGWLNGGTETADAEGGAASDSFLGRRIGNGGNWMELVVQRSGTDLRGWTIDWEEVSDGTSGSIRLSSNVALASLPAGTIVTIIERDTAAGGLDTDFSLNASAGDRWINLNSRDPLAVAFTTGSAQGHVSGSFTTSNDDWRMRVRNAAGGGRRARLRTARATGFPIPRARALRRSPSCRRSADAARRRGPATSTVTGA